MANDRIVLDHCAGQTSPPRAIRDDLRASWSVSPRAKQLAAWGAVLKMTEGAVFLFVPVECEYALRPEISARLGAPSGDDRVAGTASLCETEWPEIPFGATPIAHR